MSKDLASLLIEVKISVRVHLRQRQDHENSVADSGSAEGGLDRLSVKDAVCWLRSVKRPWTNASPERCARSSSAENGGN